MHCKRDSYQQCEKRRHETHISNWRTGFADLELIQKRRLAGTIESYEQEPCVLNVVEQLYCPGGEI